MIIINVYVLTNLPINGLRKMSIVVYIVHLWNQLYFIVSSHLCHHTYSYLGFETFLNEICTITTIVIKIHKGQIMKKVLFTFMQHLPQRHPTTSLTKIRIYTFITRRMDIILIILHFRSNLWINRNTNILIS